MSQENRDQQDPSSVSYKDKKRLTWLTLALLFLFCLLIIQFFRVQITEGEKWTKKAHNQHKWVSKEPFRRGVFYSCTPLAPSSLQAPHPFVIDVPKYHLHIDPKSIPQVLHEEIGLRLIKDVLSTKLSEKKIHSELLKKSRSRRLAMWIDKEEKDRILTWWKPLAKEHSLPLNSIFFVADYKRSYPYGHMLGHLLHTIREYKNEKTWQGIPTGGLEAEFNHLLTGKMGKRLYLRSPRHSLEIGEIIEEPQNGVDIYLTIDPYIQAILEDELEKGVKQANAKSGWAIMMHPSTGEVMAWGQYPFFSPENYRDFFNDPDLISLTKTQGAVDAQQPASVMKPITLAIALQANYENALQGTEPLFDPSAKLPTFSGVFKGRSKPFYDSGKHKFLNMDMALQKSSNIYMAHLVEEIINTKGDEWYRDKLMNIFSFGQRSGIEVPGESYGRVPKPGRKHKNGTLEWSLPTPYSLAIGHNILITSIQLIKAYATIANGGYAVKPTLVRKLMQETPSGEKKIIWENTSLPKSHQLIHSDIIKRVKRSMKFTTKVGGTARFGDIPGYSEIGKTGTSEKIVNGVYSKERYFSTFVGMAPADQSAFVLLVSMNEPEKKYLPGIGKNHNAGVCCAPVFREIGRRVLEYLEVPPDDPFGYPYGDPRRDRKKADWYLENEQLRSLYQKWNGS